MNVATVRLLLSILPSPSACSMAAIYAVYTSPTHPPIPNHLPTLIVTPHGQPSNILYSYLHTNYNTENYLLTPSPQGDLCVAKLFPPRPTAGGKSSVSDPGHSSGSSSRVVRCEASRNLKWSIANTGVISPIYKLSLPSPDTADLPLFQISKPNPNAAFWSLFYFAYAGHNIPPKRIEFGKIQKNPAGPNGGGTRISITGKTPEEKAVWQTLGEGNEDCVEWVVLCAALNLLDDEILKAADKSPPGPMPTGGPGLTGPGGPSGRPTPVSLRDLGPASSQAIPHRPGPGPQQQQIRSQTMPSPQQHAGPPNGRPHPGFRGGPPPPGPGGYPGGTMPPGQPGGFPLQQGGPPPPGHGYHPGQGPLGPPAPLGYGPGPGGQRPPQMVRGGLPAQMGRGGPPPQGAMPPPGPGGLPPGYGGRPPPPPQGQMPPPGHPQYQQAQAQTRRF